jgi:site-specific recombinase XerC
LAAFLFSPNAAIQESIERRRQAAKTKSSAAKLARRRTARRSKPKKAVKFRRDRYTAGTYARAISRAIERANAARKQVDPEAAAIPHWTPYQIRHRFDTDVRRDYGLEAAQVALGHKHARVTEIYAQRDFSLAERVAREIG